MHAVRPLPILAALTFATITLATCGPDPAPALTLAEEHQQLCGNCHLAPAPQDIPKSVWTGSVLPNMAARVGLAYGDYDPLKGLSMEESFRVTLSGRISSSRQ